MARISVSLSSVSQRSSRSTIRELSSVRRRWVTRGGSKRGVVTIGSTPSTNGYHSVSVPPTTFGINSTSGPSSRFSRDRGLLAHGAQAELRTIDIAPRFQRHFTGGIGPSPAPLCSIRGWSSSTSKAQRDLNGLLSAASGATELRNTFAQHWLGNRDPVFSRL